ncbi:cell wall-binding repeat-containing protein [Clostridium senegalense]|uniref:NlpC/P60 domain-containing protein n=1 Tax=Clostridium senegalense TaxID=1465809 RepID=A0A6M0H5J5_9CLOT|nr:cell wall-binding repeat-containing protein [Clostridium senegalense]NEU05578.1 hypothetical protein [Clostridium senegalense]
MKRKKLIALLVMGMLCFRNITVLAAESNRLCGRTRVETAIEVSKEFYNKNSDSTGNAILAAAADENLVDSLAVSPLAYKLKAPIFLNDANNSIDEVTLNELKSRNIKNVYISTGEGIISKEAEEELVANGMNVIRLGGATRYETALNILNKYKELGGQATNVCLVSGNGIADALSIAPIAAENSMPIVLAKDSDNVASELKEVVYSAQKVYAVGGESVLSTGLVNDVKGERLAGKNRYATNIEVIKKFYGSSFENIYFANGNNNHLVDSLTASVLVAGSKGPIVLLDNKLNKDTANAINGKVTDNTNMTFLGGEAFVPSITIDNIKNPPEDKPIEKPKDMGQEVVNYAMNYLGTPYVWGGDSPAGFDCSGFAQYVYRHFGVEITRTTYTQVTQGSYVARENLRPGDLVFFTYSGDGEAEHVGMYVGNNSYIHCPQPGDVVRVSTIGYGYMTARRIFN